MPQSVSQGLSFLLKFDGIGTHSFVTQQTPLGLTKLNAIKTIFVIVILICFELLMVVNAATILSIIMDSDGFSPNWIVSTNFDNAEAITTNINSNSSEEAIVTNIFLILVGIVAIVPATIGASKVALILQNCYIAFFGQTFIYPRYYLYFITIMYRCCEYYASYSTIGSILGGGDSESSVATRFGIIFNLPFLFAISWIMSSIVFGVTVGKRCGATLEEHSCFGELRFVCECFIWKRFFCILQFGDNVLFKSVKFFFVVSTLTNIFLNSFMTFIRLPSNTKYSLPKRLSHLIFFDFKKHLKKSSINTPSRVLKL